MRVFRRPAIFRIHHRSLARGTLVTLTCLWVSFHISGFPEIHPCLWLVFPLGLALAGSCDTARCLQKRWNFYHGGVLLLLYVDLMILLMIVVLLLAPFSSTLL